MAVWSLGCAVSRLELQLWHPGNVKLQRALGDDPFLLLAIAGAQLTAVLCRVCCCFVSEPFLVAGTCVTRASSSWGGLHDFHPPSHGDTKRVEEVCAWACPSHVPD